MRREWYWALFAAGAFAVGVLGAESYARLAAPGLAAAATLIAGAHPWTVHEVTVVREGPGRSSVLRVQGEVRKQSSDPAPATIVVGRIAVGEVVEVPVVFWTLLLLWPARDGRERWLRAAVGVPVFLALEIAFAGCQLLWPMADASAVLAGDPDPLPLWERCSRFLEAGGGFVLSAASALFTVAAVQWHRRPRELRP
jgi:hypothetical protein